MATTYYAWSNFTPDRDEWGKAETTIVPGDEVSQSDLGVSDEEWETLVTEGAVREQPYPKAITEGVYNGSPADYYKDLLTKVSEGAILTGDQLKELSNTGVEIEQPIVEEVTKSPGPAAAAKR
jgi:hypothetical protein